MTLTTYSFALPTRIEFGPGISRTAAAEAKAMGASKVLLVADKGVLNAGLTIAIEEELKRNSCPMPSSIRSSPTPAMLTAR